MMVRIVDEGRVCSAVKVRSRVSPYMLVAVANLGCCTRTIRTILVVRTKVHPSRLALVGRYL